jgi:HAD superfamily hydrolase (TIGR01549 family)
MKSDNLNVLIVSGGSFQGLTVIKGLRYANSVRIIIADSSEENISRYFADMFYVIPEISKRKQFIHSLLDICEKQHINLIFPCTDIELTALSENLSLFREMNIYVAVSDPALLNILRNKYLLYKFLIEKKLPALPIIDVSNKHLTFPIVGKPFCSWGSKGIVVLHSYNELGKHKLSELKANYVWQPYLKDFEEYSIDCAINFSGRISDFIVRQRLKTLGGFAVIAENVHNPAITKLIKRFLFLIRSKGARGIFNVQIFKKDSKYFISDVNPRIGTSAVYSYKWGINFPLFLCSYINPGIYNFQPRISSPTTKIKMVRYLEELWIEKANHNKVKAFVFDLDDTLIHQKLWISSKLEILWSKFKTILPQKKEFLLKAIQIIEFGNRDKVFDALSQEFQFSDSLKKDLIKNYRAIEPYDCPVFPDVLPTLNELKMRGFKLALITDNPPESQKQKIKICNLQEIFDLIIYTGELNQEKPSKIAFKGVAKLLKMPVESLVMVGDNLYKDIVGSLGAGYQSAFWVVREGTFYNFEKRFINQLVKGKYNFIKINSLKSLLWYFQK